MIGYIFCVISNCFYAFFDVYSWNKIYDETYNIKKYSLRDSFLPNAIITICYVLFIFFISQPIRFFVTNLSLFIINYIFVNRNIKKALISTILTQVIVNISEFLFVILVSAITGNQFEGLLTNNYFISFMNLCVPSIAFALYKTSNYFKYLIKNLKNINNNESIIYSLMIIIIMVITTIESHMKVSMPILLITNTLVTTFFIILIIKITKEKERYNSINNKYQISISSLKEYETMINKFRIASHENKNELLIIRNMTTNKKVTKYIDNLIGNKIKDSEKIMHKTAKIPEGGLRATIYSKMCLMEKHKINYSLEIAKDITTIDLINIDDDLMLNLCKILCVFLDNAIEAVKELKKKQIRIEIYKIDNKLNIDITNNYKGNIQIEKLGTKKYTTKGENHGYGLSLVGQVIEKNSKFLENEKYINGNQFTQSIKVKVLK